MKDLKLARLLLTALTVVMGLQVLRALLTMTVYWLGEDYGFMTTLIPGILVFIMPFLAPAFARLIGAHQTLIVSIGGLALLRLVVQVLPIAPVNFLLLCVAMALALFALALGLVDSRNAAGGYTFVVGLLLGLTLDATLLGAFSTWDYIWQRSAIPIIVALVVSGATLYLLRTVAPTMLKTYREDNFKVMLPAALLGAFMMLQVIFLQNIAFVASFTGQPLPIALGIVLVADALALAVVLWTMGKQWLPGQEFVLAVVMIALLTRLNVNQNPLALTAVVIGQLLATRLIAGVLAGGIKPSATRQKSIVAAEGGNGSLWRTSTVLGIGSLSFVVLTILYYIGYDIKLPIPNTILPVVAGVILALGSFVKAGVAVDVDKRFALVPVICLIVPIALYATTPARAAQPVEGKTMHLMDYNIHQAINTDGFVDPEAVAQAIEAQNPDVVTIQEATRGWAISGSLDVAEWLSRRLDMAYSYAPAADGQFGNLILSRLPIVDASTAIVLPQGGALMGRSTHWMQVQVGADKLTVINVHLHQLAGDSDIRIPQVKTVLDTWKQQNDPNTLIAGDMNAHPGEADVQQYLDAGLTSAQDTVGDPAAFTFSSFEPVERIDWIFASTGLLFSDFKIGTGQASDHLPLMVTVTLP